MARGRKPKVDWEAYREQLIELRTTHSLTDVNKVLFEKLGVSVSNARLSQIFTKWKNEDSGGTTEQENVVNAN